MKFLLIHPNIFAERYVSVGIGMISSVLKSRGHDVSFFDTSRFSSNPLDLESGASERQARKMEAVLQFKPVHLPEIIRSTQDVRSALKCRIDEFQPNLIGISATSSEILLTQKLADFIRPTGIPIILGGAHATVAPEESISIDGIQMVLRGEGEEAILELADAVDAGRIPHTIPNIWFKEGKSVYKNPVRPYIRNLDSLPFVDLDIFDPYHSIGAYRGRRVVYGRFEAGRGCPYDCTYCINRCLHEIYHLENGHVRMRTPERAISELRYGQAKLKFDILRMLDETFLAAKSSWLEEFVALYRQHIDRPMVVTTRPETINEQRLKILRRANDDIQINIGIESGNEHIRKKVCKRNHSNRMIIDAFRLCRHMGFRTASFNMVGLPGETRKEFFDTIELNRQAGVDQPMLSYFYPFPGTQLREECVDRGYIEDRIHEVDYAVSSKLNMPAFPADQIEGLKRTFIMYVKMDRVLYPHIKKAETDDLMFERMIRQYQETFNDRG